MGEAGRALDLRRVFLFGSRTRGDARGGFRSGSPRHRLMVKHDEPLRFHGERRVHTPRIVAELHFEHVWCEDFDHRSDLTANEPEFGYFIQRRNHGE